MFFAVLPYLHAIPSIVPGRGVYNG